MSPRPTPSSSTFHLDSPTSITPLQQTRSRPEESDSRRKLSKRIQKSGVLGLRRPSTAEGTLEGRGTIVETPIKQARLPSQTGESLRDDFALALQASREEAELQQARRFSEQSELNETLARSSDSFYLESLEQSRLEKEDFESILRLEAKGKERGYVVETTEQRREREEMEMVMAMSLSEISGRQDSSLPDVGTSGASPSTQSSRRTSEYQSERSPYHSSNSTNSELPSTIPEIADGPYSNSPNISTTYRRSSLNFQTRPRSSFIVTNPDSESISDEEATADGAEEEIISGPPPPAYDPLPLSSPGIVPDIEHAEGTYYHDQQRPGPSPLPSQSLSTRLNSSSSYLSTLQERGENQSGNLSANRLSGIANAGSFSTLSSILSSRRNSSASSMISNEPREEVNSVAASFYPIAVSSAMGYGLNTITPSLVIDELGTPIPHSPEGNGENPFDERIAAVEYAEEMESDVEYFGTYAEDDDDEAYAQEVAGDGTREGTGEESEIEESESESRGMYRDQPFIPLQHRTALAAINTNPYYTPSIQSIESPTTELTPMPETFTASQSRRSLLAVTPTRGGFVDNCSVNAVADEQVFKGIQFGFLVDSNRHPPLELSGPFPDVAQLSRLIDEDGEELYRCFAVEGRSWRTLLLYLMWHGNSKIEATPDEMIAEPNLSVSITLEFFKSFLDGGTRVRCLIDLLPTPKVESSFSVESLEPSCPEITIILPIRLNLPLSLSSLALSLSNFHSTARQAPSRLFPSSTSESSKLPKSLKNLPLAIDLFRKINGEIEESSKEDGEKNRLLRLKDKLRRRGQIGLVKGSSKRRGEAVGAAAGLQAELITPFNSEL